MGRARKQTAEYFPHFVGGSRKTIFVLEQNWGNDGYAFWFKLLELLCNTDGHYYDCSSAADFEYLTALARVDEETAEAIIEKLVNRGKLDKALWEKHRVIWCQTLVDNLAGMYAKRTTDIPLKPMFDGDEGQDAPPEAAGTLTEPTNTTGGGNIGGEQETPPTKPKRGRRTSELSAEQKELFDRFYKAYPKKVDPAAAEKAWAKISPPPDDAMTDKIIQAVEDAKRYDSRFKDRQYTPNPATWLNAKGYMSEYTQEVSSGDGFGARRGYSEPAAGFKPSGGFRGGREA